MAWCTNVLESRISKIKNQNERGRELRLWMWKNREKREDLKSAIKSISQRSTFY